MSLLDFFKKQKPSLNYFGLLLKEEQGMVLLIKRVGLGARLADYDKFNFSNGWEHLLEDVDEALFRLETKNKLQLEETIFFVFSHFIDETTNQIKKPYQATIKNLAKNLELKPLGFIDCREAVVKSIQQKEEMPLTAILVELDKNDLYVFVYKGGQPVFSKLISRTDNLIDDLSLVFEDLQGKQLLPSRIILYNSSDLDFEVTKIVSHRWPTDLFVQLPKVEIVSEKDILESLVDIFNQQLITSEVKESVVTTPLTTKTGFVIGEDIADEETEATFVPKEERRTASLWQRLPKINWSLPKLSLNPNFWQKRILLVVGLIFIGISLFLNEYFLHRASLEVFVPSVEMKKTVTVVASTDGKEDLTIKPITRTVEVSTTKAATGKKDIGEPARGEVTLYNFEKEKTFDKGTKIETKDLFFILDDEVKVASASLTSDGSAKLPGKAKVKVTAVQIGSESNLAKSQTFKIENLDSELYFAKNEADLTGGTKKQITTVSKTDYQNLEAEVSKKAKNQKLSDLKLGADERIISQLSKTELADTNYSKEIGEEASQITLTANVKTTIYAYKKSKLIELLTPSLSKEIKSGYSLDQDKVNYRVEKVEEGDGVNKLKVVVSGQAIKMIDKDKVIKLLLGKKENQIDQILKTGFATTGYNLEQKQPLPLLFFSRRLPLFPKNFEIKIDSL